MDKRFFRRCARNAAFSLLGCLLLAAPAFAAQEITVSGAASLTNAFTEIKGLFEKKYPDIKVHTNFAASNPLLKQMEEGAPVDVFASADQETMDKAAAKKLVDTATRKDFALNDLVMVVPSDRPGPRIWPSPKSSASPWGIPTPSPPAATPRRP